jgi:hypothetical protein
MHVGITADLDNTVHVWMAGQCRLVHLYYPGGWLMDMLRAVSAAAMRTRAWTARIGATIAVASGGHPPTLQIVATQC